MIDLDAIVGTAVMEAQLEGGISPDVVVAQANGTSRWQARQLVASSETEVNPQAARWTKKEETFLRDNLGKLSTTDIAEHLGRTEAAIKIRWTRKGFDAPSKQPDEMVAREIGDLLGKCGKSIGMMIDRGILPGRRLPMEDRPIRVVERKALLRWLVQPKNWIYFKHEQVTDPHIRRLLALRREQWDDEWWSTGQVGQYHGVDHRLVNKYIHDGKLPAVFWSNWHVLRSDAVKMHFQTGRGSVTFVDWTSEGDAFIILARAVGLSFAFINQLRNSPRQSRYRLQALGEKRRIKPLIKRYYPNVQYDPTRGLLWVDWQHYKRRFPGLVRAIDGFLDGRELKWRSQNNVRNVMRSWSEWFAETAEQQEFAHRLKYSQTATLETLHERHETLKGWGIDPFGPKERQDA